MKDLVEYGKISVKILKDTQLMERITGETEIVTYYPESLKDDIAERMNQLANEMQRAFWYFAQNVHRYVVNPLHEDDLINSVAKRFFGGGVHAVGALFGAFLAVAGFALKGLSNRFHSREFTYWEGQGEEVRPEKPKVLHLNACMFPGGLPYAFGGVRTAGKRMKELKAFIEDIHPDIFFLCEFSQTLSGKLFEYFREDYRHFFVNVGSNAKGMDASMTVVSREAIINEPKFFPSMVRAEGDQKAFYRGFFHIETKELSYLYVHLYPKETDRAKEIRQEQLVEIKKLTEDYANGKIWVVLGDINIKRGSAGHRAMLKMGFRDVVWEQYGDIETCINGLEEGEKRNPESLDAFLVIGEGLQVETKVHNTYEDPRKALSDHKGISLVIESGLTH